MSCYEWERGTIKLPTGQAPVLRKLLNDAAEKHIAELTAGVNKGWEVLKKLPPAKRTLLEWNAELNAAHHALENLGLNEDCYALLRRYDAKDAPSWSRPTQKEIVRSVVHRYKSPSAETVTVFRCGEATISLCGNTVEWDVPENNHAVERAEGHPLALCLFRYLDRVNWTSRSGGQIIGNNEYNTDSHDAGAGGNYVVREYSAAASKRQRAAESRASLMDWTWRTSHSTFASR